MKKIKYGYIEDFKPVVLYLDDLEEIVEILKELSDNVRIFTDEYELDSLDELQKISQETLNTLIIQVGGSKTSFPDISLKFLPHDILFDVNEDTATKRGVVETTKEFLNGHRRKLYWLAVLGDWLSIFLMSMSVAILLFGGFRFMSVLVACAMILLGAIWLSWSHELVNKKWSVIHLKRRIDSPSFWKRNKDRIIIVIITTILNWLVFQFLKKP